MGRPAGGRPLPIGRPLKSGMSKARLQGGVSWQTRGVLLALLALWWLPWLPPLWQHLLPNGPELVRDPGVGVTNSSRTQYAILALTALALLGWRPRWSGWSSAGVWLALFLSWSAGSALLGPDPLESVFFLLGWVAAACVWCSAPAVLPRNPGQGWYIVTLHLPLILAGLLSLVPALATPGQDFRAAGPFQLPGVLATWLLMILPLAVLELWRAPLSSLWWPLASSTLGLATLTMTFSRAAWLAGIAQMALMILLQAGTSARTLWRWAAFGAVGLGGLILLRHHLSGLQLLWGVALLGSLPVLAASLQRRLPGAVLLRVLLLAMLAGLMVAAVRPAGSLGDHAEQRLSTLSGTDDSAMGRVMFWQAALTLSLQHPILGVGPGRFSESYPQVQKYYYYFSDSAHGALLELLAEVGWVGAALFLTALGLGVRQTRSNATPAWTATQQAALLGLLSGAIYSQVEVGYHYAGIWTTAAFLLALAQAQAPPLAEKPPRAIPLWGLLAAPAALLCLFPWQKRMEDSVRRLEPVETYRMARAVSDQIRFWPRPLLTALAYGLRTEQPVSELEPLAQRALSQARGESVTYQLAGEIDLLQRRYPQARENFARALELDPFNHPGSLHGLWQVAQATNDEKLKSEVIERTLSTYDLVQGWEIAHIGHRENLALELRPLLYDIADALRPDLEPTRSEPLYRFLVETGGEARGLFGLGVALTTQGRVREGYELMRQAHQMNPVYPLPEPPPEPEAGPMTPSPREHAATRST
jgi:hypothetical protein